MTSMKRLLWIVFAVIELLLLARADWGMAGLVALIPVAVGLVLAVNDWCLAPLRNAEPDIWVTEIQEWREPDPTLAEEEHPVSTNGSGRSLR
jgi:hypothetical protein